MYKLRQQTGQIHIYNREAVTCKKQKRLSGNKERTKLLLRHLTVNQVTQQRRSKTTGYLETD